MKKQVLFLIAVLGLFFRTYAQQPGIIRCFSDEMLHQHEQDFPNLKMERERLEEMVSYTYLNPSSGKTTAVVIIPVVVHVIRTAAGAANDISVAQIQSQIDVLNEDYRHMNGTPGFGAGVDMEIQFCLATLDPSGVPTTGITRTTSSLSNHSTGQETTLKNLIKWPQNRYLNIWIVNSIAGGILGYATFPSNGTNANDGVVIADDYFGRGVGTVLSAAPYNLGRTATHEVGHWLGLYHTFQGGCAGTTAANCGTAGDRVCDTPPTASANFGCPGTQNTCTETPTDLNDQTRNYMDYTNDACMDMFTAGQKTRWLGFSTSDSYRSNLISAANAAATGCNTPMALSVVLFKGNSVADGNRLSWIVPHASGFVDQVVVERSSDGVSFLPVSGNLRTDAGYDYSWLDHQKVASPSVYYRIKVTDIRGEMVMSPVIEITNSFFGKDLAIYPNPAGDELNVTGMQVLGVREISLCDITGHVLAGMEIPEDLSVVTISLKDIPPGVYFLHARSDENTISTRKVIHF